MNALTKQAGVVVKQHRLPALVLTCTPAGILLATAPDQLPVNTAGTGDTVSGALAWRLAVATPGQLPCAGYSSSKFRSRPDRFLT
jgi:hypothetical protein